MKKLFSPLVACFKRKKEWWSLWFARRRLEKQLSKEMKSGISHARFGQLMDLSIRARCQLQMTDC